MINPINLNQILEITNEILREEDLAIIDVDDNLKLCGFSSMNMLLLILKLEKGGYKLSNIAIESITSVKDLYNKIQNQIGGRTII